VAFEFGAELFEQDDPFADETQRHLQDSDRRIASPASKSHGSVSGGEDGYRFLFVM
jgi:hypothetical protein